MVLALSENVLPVADLVQALGSGWDSTKPVQFLPDSVGGGKNLAVSLRRAADITGQKSGDV